jgi:hypothetical protein
MLLRGACTPAIAITNAGEIDWPSSPYLQGNESGLVRTRAHSRSNTIPRRSSVRFEDGIGRKFGAEEGGQFGVRGWEWCRKRRDDSAR